METSKSIPTSTSFIQNGWSGKKALNMAGNFWFAIAFLGQIIFAGYILAYYYPSIFSGDWEAWNRTLEHTLEKGSILGNFFIVTHILLAFSITAGGPMQFIPWLRKKAMGFHRWNGRIYILTAFLISIAGLYLVLLKGPVGGWVIGSGNLLNASLIMISSVFTWRFAVGKQMKKHERWAIRTFLMVSGVWFFRVIFALWIGVNGGAPGHTDTFDGPFDFFMAFGHSLIPLGVAELYFWAKDKKGTSFQYSAAIGLFLLTLVMAFGIVMATFVFWLPPFQH